LAGISDHGGLGSAWVFKGGTCLKKCYFETYRFSEDLDFTITNPDQLDEGFLVNAFKEIADWVYDQAGIEVPRDLIRFEVFKNSRGKLAAEGRVCYRGPLQPKHDLPRVKLDITSDEVLVLDPENREVHHPYSDKPEDGIHIQCYRFEELFAEKIRALAERLRPRDLYDVIHLHRRGQVGKDRALVLSTLETKCEFKGMPVPTVEFLMNMPERAELETEWKNMLAHQLPALPPFEQFWLELPTLFEWLYRAAERVLPRPMPVIGPAIDETWHPPAAAQAWHTTAPLEIIRFAAANQLCVDLTYNGSRRLIEPYSLRRTRDGNLLLYAVKHNTGEDRFYRVDRIQAAVITKTPFTPRYVVELTPSGPISAPPTARRTIPRPVRRTTIRIPRTGSIPRLGPRHVFECPLCGKQFARKSYDSSLNKHKNKQGYPCPGTFGIYVTTKY
jgi:predicted nucleotidyltransferase component of viral defense system